MLRKKALIALTFVLGCALMTGCRNRPLEEAGEKADEAVEEVADEVDDAIDG